MVWLADSGLFVLPFSIVDTTLPHLALILRYCGPIRLVVLASIKRGGDRALDEIHKFFHSTQVLPTAILKHQMLRCVLFGGGAATGETQMPPNVRCCGVSQRLQLRTRKTEIASVRTGAKQRERRWRHCQHQPAYDGGDLVHRYLEYAAADVGLLLAQVLFVLGVEEGQC